MFKIFTLLALISLVLITCLYTDIFSIIPQPINVKQMMFIGISILAFSMLIIFGLKRNTSRALYLLFFFYPFLAQSAFYLNISSPFFIMTPVFLYLVLTLMFSRNFASPFTMQIIIFFCASILISVLIADNKNTAFTYFILGVGGFCITVYLVYVCIRTASDPLIFIRGLVLSIVTGAILYFIIEVVAFGLQPHDVFNIISRKWYLLPAGRYFTGGYREPAGLAFVYASIFWVILSLYQFESGGKKRFIYNPVFLALLASLFFLLISGTRNAIFSVVATGIVLWLLRIRLGLARAFKFKFWHLLALLLLIGVSTFYLIPRTILSAGTAPRSTTLEPTIVRIGANTYELVGTTAMYYEKTFISFQDFIKYPLGSGPLNATPYKDDPEGGLRYYFSFVSNIFVIGATFGWLSLFLWLLFSLSCLYFVFKVRRYVSNKNLYSLTVVFLAIILGSLLPGSYYLGPLINWSNFIFDQPISPKMLSVPAEYPAVISGVLVGCMIGLIEVQRREIRAAKQAKQSQLEMINPKFQSS
jgi:hypothetical protein